MSKKPKFQTVTGMHDILPEQGRYYEKIYHIGKSLAEFYGFQKINTPILEYSQLFEKGTGQSTEVVQKQMFCLRTRGGDHLCLRPEATPPIVRAYIEHGMANLAQPVKLWSFGPFFRYEKPQLGRFRQFWHLDFEILGEKEPVADVYLIQIFYNLLTDLKFKDLTIEVNCLGQSCCRPYYKKILSSYLKRRESYLCADCRRRLKENVLRVLDCKQEKCQKIVSAAPQMINHLCDDCHRHFKEVLEFLDKLQLPYYLNPYLVRGLDYYTKTVFEIFEKNSKNALAGGGRYDTLVKILGGKPCPALGGAIGVERVISSMKEKGLRIKNPVKPGVFLAQIGSLAKRKTLKLIEEFRAAKIPIAESLGRDSLKSQLNLADKIGVKYTLILGQRESLEETIIIRDMKTGKQETKKMAKIVKEIKKRLGK